MVVEDLKNGFHSILVVHSSDISSGLLCIVRYDLVNKAHECLAMYSVKCLGNVYLDDIQWSLAHEGGCDGRVLYIFILFNC